MSTIRETALAAVGGRVPRGVGTQARAALQAVEAREQEMFQDIVEDGVALGATRDQVAHILRAAGMTAPVEPVTVESTDSQVTSLQQAVARLSEKVEAGLAFARRRGYRG